MKVLFLQFVLLISDRVDFIRHSNEYVSDYYITCSNTHLNVCTNVCYVFYALQPCIFQNNLVFLFFKREWSMICLAARCLSIARHKATLDSCFFKICSHEKFSYLFHELIAKLSYIFREWDHEYCVNPEKLKSMHAFLFPWSFSFCCCIGQL